jgi:antitoxin FitA
MLACYHGFFHGEMLVASLHVRNVDEDLVRRLKERAARHGRSAEAEHRDILREVLLDEDHMSFEELAAEVRKLTAGTKQTPSEILQREGRDER